MLTSWRARPLARGAVLAVLAAFPCLLPAASSAAAGFAGQGPGDLVPRQQEQAGVREASAAAPLAPRHRTWLEEEVVYIISELEEEAFRSLGSDDDRDAFIEAFWRARDPTPGTVRNEAREEHRRRIEYANRHLGRETPREGWQTDRGRIYIQLGEPRDVQRFVDPNAFWPMELWFYQLDPRASGLPPAMYVLFYRPEMGREFQLYTPGADGPSSLAKQITLQMASPGEIVTRLLQTVSHEVAIASVTMDAGERVDFNNPMVLGSSPNILANIARLPTRGVDVSYARALAMGAGEVDARVDFSAVPLQMEALALWDERGLPYLHYAVQVPPEKVALGQYERDYYLSLDLGVRVVDLRGNEVLAASDHLEQHFDESRAQELIRSPFAFLDRVDLVPGVYDVSVTLSNPLNEDRGLARMRARVPAGGGDRWDLGDLLLARSATEVARRPGQGESMAFRFGGEQFVPLVGRRVGRDTELVLVAQLLPPAGFEGGLEVEAGASLLDEAGTALETVYAGPVSAAPAPGPTRLRVTLPLTAASVGDHSVRIFAELPGDRVLSREAAITVIPGAGAGMPQVLMAGEAPAGGVDEYVTRGVQHLRKGETGAAETFFRQGLDLEPSALQLRRPLAGLLLDQGRFTEAVEVLRPVADHPGVTPFDLLRLSEALRGAADAAEAVRVSRRVLERWSPTAAAHREHGAALEAAGDRQAAIEAYEASLGLDPEQPGVREALERLRRQG